MSMRCLVQDIGSILRFHLPPGLVVSLEQITLLTAPFLHGLDRALHWQTEEATVAILQIAVRLCSQHAQQGNKYSEEDLLTLVFVKLAVILCKNLMSALTENNLALYSFKSENHR